MNLVSRRIPPGGGSGFMRLQRLADDDGQVEQLLIGQAALTASQSQQRLDQLLLLFAGRQHLFN